MSASYGPFHRLQWAALNELMEKSGMVGGKAARNIFGGGGTPAVKAFDGALPPNKTGIEFYTEVKPTSGVPGGVIWWYRGSPGVVLIDADNEIVGIPIMITKRVD